jgi:Cu-Zn family superoxide dismutase
MKKTVSPMMFARLALLILPLAVGCAGTDEKGESDAEEMIASSGSAALLVYDDPYAPDMAGTPNPIPKSATATAEAFDVEGKLRIQLTVLGLPVARTFGSHLHKLPCDDPMKAGGHYQHMPFPTGGMATDPSYANATNEAWLDFTTDATGKGETDLTVDWLPRPGEAKGIIIHHMASGIGGVSGAKLACLPITGF